MRNDFKVNVNDAFNFDITQDDISNLDALKISETNYHILQENKSYSTEFTNSNFAKKSYQIKINNNVYDVQISNKLDGLIKAMGFTIGTLKQIDAIKAPMPGLLLEIHVEAGQEVKENDLLFILEAMKMENSIVSPRHGTIKSVLVKKGDAVEKNQLLIEFEN